MKNIKLVALDDDMQNMLISSIRYAIGRRTYIVSWTINYIIPLLPDFSNKNLAVIWQDLTSAFCEPKNLGDSCDMRDWARLYRSVWRELNKRPMNYELETCYSKI